MKKTGVVVSKIDFEKACDEVKNLSYSRIARWKPFHLSRGSMWKDVLQEEVWISSKLIVT
jgi:hypothetical protein